MIERESPGAVAPPFARAIRVTAGASLALAGMLNGVPQYVTYLMGKTTNRFADHVAWAEAHPAAAAAEQYALLGSMLFVTLGILGLAQVCRWRSPRLTAAGTVLAVWGMWGFHTILAVGFLLSTMAAEAPEATRAFAAAVDADPPIAALLAALGPHMVGSFLGLLLLGIGWLRSGFPPAPAILLFAFLAWDFLWVPYGPIEPHLLLVAAWVWMGVLIMRMPDAVWRGARPAPRPTAADPA